MRHARQIGDDGLTTDVFAQRQRQWRCEFVISATLENFTQRHQLAILVRNFQAHIGLARNHLDNPHTDNGQGTGQILRQVRYLADFHAGRRIQFESGNDRARQYRHHFNIDIEVLKLDFDQPRHRLQRFLGKAAFLLRWIIKQRQRWQFSIGGWIEKWHLAFLLRPVAWRQYRHDWLNFRRRAAGRSFFLGLENFLARRLLPPPFRFVFKLAYFETCRLVRHQAPSTQPIHDTQPGNTEKNRH